MKMIPERTLRGLDLYLNEGIRPGDFLYGVLCNDLLTATLAADSENLEALSSIVRLCYNNLPGNCWGSREVVDAWLRDFDPVTATYVPLSSIGRYPSGLNIH